MVNLVARRKPAMPVKAPVVPVAPPPESDGDSSQATIFWPDFGSFSVASRALLAVLLLALMIVLARSVAFSAGLLQDFVIVASLAIVISLIGIGVMKLSHHYLKKVSNKTATWIVTAILVITSVVVLEGVSWGLFFAGLGEYPWREGHYWMVAKTVVIAALAGVFVVQYFVADHRAEMETQAKQADRLQALQSRIRPHFMFNSLNSVASLIRLDPEVAEQALEDLADLFRVLLADARKMVPITVEGELARQYLEIEKIRLGERLAVRWTASNVPRSALLPSLTLQPLVENAVYHGIEPSSAGGTIVVRQWSEGETLNILISNPLPDVQSKSHRKGNNIALDNVRERLERHFGGRALLRNGPKDGYYEVQVRVPIMRG